MASEDAEPKPSTGFFAAMAASLSNLFRSSKPWSELYDYRSISTPNGFWDYVNRLRKNVAYFGVNYLIFLLAILVGIVAFRPVALGMLFALGTLWVYLLVVRASDLTVGSSPCPF